MRVIPKFDKEKLLLDNIYIIASGDEQFIPYRVVANGYESELIMTNQQTASVSDVEHWEQLDWMKTELQTIKKILDQ